MSGMLDFAELPPPRRSESLIDWLVRAKIAQTPQQAAEGLLIASGMFELWRETVDMFNNQPPA